MINKLQYVFQRPLPGVEAQSRMSHISRRMPSTIPSDAKESAVMMLFYPHQSDWHIALIQRTNNNPNDRHGGQISFPGGRMDASDVDLQATALRETEEEIGVPKEDIHVLGALTNLYIPVSKFKVQPYVGLLDYTPDFIPQLSEVEHILSPRFSSLQNNKSLRYKDMMLSPRLTIKDVPYFDVEQRVVWGATAMIISELLVMME